jgi:hypothetical protein
VVAVRVLQVPVLQVVGVALVLDGDVPAARTVLVVLFARAHAGKARPGLGRFPPRRCDQAAAGGSARSGRGPPRRRTSAATGIVPSAMVRPTAA